MYKLIYKATQNTNNLNFKAMQTAAQKIEAIVTALNSIKGITAEAAEVGYGYGFGFRIDNKGVYHWFNVYEDGYIMFHHSYSQNTGKSKKSWNHGYKVGQTLERLVGKELVDSKCAVQAVEKHAEDFNALMQGSPEQVAADMEAALTAQPQPNAQTVQVAAHTIAAVVMDECKDVAVLQAGGKTYTENEVMSVLIYEAYMHGVDAVADYCVDRVQEAMAYYAENYELEGLCDNIKDYAYANYKSAVTPVLARVLSAAQAQTQPTQPSAAQELASVRQRVKEGETFIIVAGDSTHSTYKVKGIALYAAPQNTNQFYRQCNVALGPNDSEYMLCYTTIAGTSVDLRVQYRDIRFVDLNS